MIFIMSLGYTVLKNKGHLWLHDLYMYWQSNAYAIRGYDLNRCISGDIFIDSIGQLTVALTLPWSRFLGNIVCPGYMSFRACTIYFYILWIILSIISIIVTIKKINTLDTFNSLESIILAVTTFFAPLYWEDAINSGNLGGLLCILCYLGIMTMDKNCIISAICFSIACSKPQIGAIFVLMTMCLKKYKVFICTVFILVVNTIISTIYVVIINSGQSGVGSLLGLISYVMSSGAAGDNTNSFYAYGIFDPLIYCGFDAGVVTVLSAMAGVICIGLFSKFVMNNVEVKNRLYFAGGAQH